MYLFPSYHYLDLLEDPVGILEYAGSLKYIKDATGRYPGSRSEGLQDIDEELFLYVGDKLIRLMFGAGTEDVQWRAKAFFQKITYEDLGNNTKNTGWIHKDKNLLTFIVYLTPGNSALGTSIYLPKKEYRTEVDQTAKHLVYEGKSVSDTANYMRSFEANQAKFDKLASFQGRFNSTVGFSSNQWHAADLHLVPGEERTTLIFFFDEVYSSRGYPGVAAKLST